MVKSTKELARETILSSVYESTAAFLPLLFDSEEMKGDTPTLSLQRHLTMATIAVQADLTKIAHELKWAREDRQGQNDSLSRIADALEAIARRHGLHAVRG